MEVNDGGDVQEVDVLDQLFNALHEAGGHPQGEQDVEKEAFWRGGWVGGWVGRWRKK